MTHDEALSLVFDEYTGIGGNVDFINSIFEYLSKRSDFFASDRSPMLVHKLAKIYHDRAVNGRQHTVSNTQFSQITALETDMDKIPEQETAEYDVSEPAAVSKLAKPVGNGGITDKYSWTQSLSDVTVSIPVPFETRCRDLTVSLESSSCSIVLGTDVVVQGTLFKKINVNDSTWTLDKELSGTQSVTLFLDKVDTMVWWECVFKGDPRVDVTIIVPENSKIDDLDINTRRTVEMMMFNQRQTYLDKPVSVTSSKDDVLTKFMAAHPEMDFSGVNMRNMPGNEGNRVSLEEVGKHNTSKDIWVIIHGRAYDVTVFQDDHPGGPDILHSHAGIDATEEFEDTFHSQAARNMLKEYYIGDVIGMEQSDIFSEHHGGHSGGSTDTSINLLVLLPLVAIVAGIAYKFLVVE